MSEASERDTRDVAVRSEAMIEGHIQDCTKWREIVQKSFNELRADLKQVNNRVLIILGGLIVVGKLIDFYLTYHRG